MLFPYMMTNPSGDALTAWLFDRIGRKEDAQIVEQPLNKRWRQEYLQSVGGLLMHMTFFKRRNLNCLCCSG